MNCILSTEHHANFNIAAEEFLLKNSADDFFMIYRNNPSVIIGKHQNALAEINHSYLTEKGIQLVRRLSGGGTVYHDLGNVNFLFIQSGEAGKLVDFKRFLMPILTILKKMHLPVEYGGRNDLLLNGKKISGNAEHVFRNRILHHGTLLYSSDLSALENVLKVNAGKYIDKAVQSVRSKVTNISEYLEAPVSAEKFSENIFEEVKSMFAISRNYSFSDDDLGQIHSLIERKYGNWNWNYAYSPDFEYLLHGKYKQIPFHFKIMIQEGRIAKLHCEKSAIEAGSLNTLESQLIGITFNEEDVNRILQHHDFRIEF